MSSEVNYPPSLISCWESKSWQPPASLLGGRPHYKFSLPKLKVTALCSIKQWQRQSQGVWSLNIKPMLPTGAPPTTEKSVALPPWKRRASWTREKVWNTSEVVAPKFGFWVYIWFLPTIALYVGRLCFRVLAPSLPHRPPEVFKGHICLKSPRDAPIQRERRLSEFSCKPPQLCVTAHYKVRFSYLGYKTQTVQQT